MASSAACFVAASTILIPITTAFFRNFAFPTGTPRTTLCVFFPALHLSHPSRRAAGSAPRARFSPPASPSPPSLDLPSRAVHRHRVRRQRHRAPSCAPVAPLSSPAPRARRASRARRDSPPSRGCSSCSWRRRSSRRFVASFGRVVRASTTSSSRGRSRSLGRARRARRAARSARDARMRKQCERAVGRSLASTRGASKSRTRARATTANDGRDSDSR